VACDLRRQHMLWFTSSTKAPDFVAIDEFDVTELRSDPGAAIRRIIIARGMKGPGLIADCKDWKVISAREGGAIGNLSTCVRAVVNDLRLVGCCVRAIRTGVTLNAGEAGDH